LREFPEGLDTHLREPANPHRFIAAVRQRNLTLL
jgi:hypothetical protein